MLVYLLQAQDDILIGPWRTRHADGDLVLEPDKGQECFRFSAMIAEAGRIEPTAAEDAPICYLLNRLPEAQGEPVDLADGRQLAKWLLGLARTSELKQILDELDRKHPRWHALLQEAFEKREDPDRLRLLKGRWQRIDEILEAIHFDTKELAEFVERPPFDEFWHRATEQHRIALEEQAEQEAAPQLAKLRAERDTLTAQVEKRRAELETMERQLAEQSEHARELREHFEDDRQRLLRDFAAYQAVVGGTAIPAPMGTGGPLLDELLITPTDGPPPATTGAPEINQHAFVRRLASRVARRHGTVRPEVCTLCHAAVLAVRALLVPHPGWSRAYAEAMGPAARLVSIQTEPHWLRFGDFRAAGFDEAWRAASEDGDRLYLLHLEDLDRALPELWLRPCLDLLAGFRDRLPDGRAWPANLRLLASPAPDAAVLPLSPFVVGCFTALPRLLDAGPSSPGTDQPADEPSGTAFARWQIWRRADTEDKADAAEPEMTQLPALDPALLRAGLRPAVEADLRRLAVALKAQDFGILDIEQRSQQLRVVWPQQYLPPEEDDERFA